MRKLTRIAAALAIAAGGLVAIGGATVHADSSGCSTTYSGGIMTVYKARCDGRIVGGPTQYRARIYCNVGGYTLTDPSWHYIGSGDVSTTPACVGSGKGYVDKR